MLRVFWERNSTKMNYIKGRGAYYGGAGICVSKLAYTEQISES